MRKVILRFIGSILAKLYSILPKSWQSKIAEWFGGSFGDP